MSWVGDTVPAILEKLQQMRTSNELLANEVRAGYVFF